MNGDQRDYWKEKYEQEVLGKPPPKEYVVKEFTPVGQLTQDLLNFIKDKLP